MELVLINTLGETLLFAEVDTIEEGRQLWCDVAKYGAKGYLSGFNIIGDTEPTPLYEGNYNTDEC